MSGDKSSESLMQFEEELAELFRQAHRDAVKEALEAVDEAADAVILEGRTCRRVLTESKEYMTMAGPVVVRRALFRDRRDASTRSFALVDKRVGIVDGFWTPKAAREALWMVTQMVPKKAAEAMKRLGGMSPSKSSLDRLPKAVSERWETERAQVEQVLFETQKVPEGTSVLAVSLDGVYAPIEKEEGDSHIEKRERKHAQGLAARGADAFREVGCASIAFYSAAGEVLGAVRFGRAPEYKKLGVKAMLEAQLRAILQRETRQLDVVFLSDGAGDHWEFFSSLQIPGHQVLDYFHATEHLNAALGAAYGEGSVKARRAFAEKSHILLEEPGGAATVKRALARMAGMAGLSAHRKRILDRAVRYFSDHAERMHYAQLRADGLPIGSGVMEASCKTLVAQRFKLSGQRWSVPGVQAVLTPRGWDQSDRFDEAFALAAAFYQQPVAVISPVERRTPASG